MPNEKLPLEGDEGLPEMAEGSRWNGEAVEDRSDRNTRVWIANQLPTLGGCPCVWFTTTREAKEHGAWLPDVRHAIARFDRANGCYWADLIRRLVIDLNVEAAEQEVDAVATGMHGRDYLAMRDISKRLLAILDELKAKGVC